MRIALPFVMVLVPLFAACGSAPKRGASGDETAAEKASDPAAPAAPATPVVVPTVPEAPAAPAAPATPETPAVRPTIDPGPAGPLPKLVFAQEVVGKNLPAISIDGKTIVQYRTSGSERSGRAQEMLFIDVATDKEESTSFPCFTCRPGPGPTARELAPVKKAMASVNARLKTQQWAPLTPFNGSKVWRAPKLTLTDAAGKVVLDESHPKWATPPAPPCDDNDQPEGCGCTFEQSIADTFISADGKLVLLTLIDTGDHCTVFAETPSTWVLYPR